MKSAKTAVIRQVALDTVLGIDHDKQHHTFKLKKGDKIQVFDTDKYHKSKVIIQGIETRMYNTTLERITR